MWTNLRIACHLTSGSFLLFINNYSWPDILFHGQGELQVKLIFSDLTSSSQSVSTCISVASSDDAAICHIFRNSIFDWTTNSQFSYCIIRLGPAEPTCSSSYLAIKSEKRQGDETQICSRQWEFELSNMIFTSFAQKVVLLWR